MPVPPDEGIQTAKVFIAKVRATEFDAWLDRLLGGPLIGDGIEVDLWRGLPDSPNA